MFAKILPKNRSIVYAWLISYVSILLIPLIVSVIVYFVSSNVLAEEIQSANDSLLKEVQYTIDSKLNDIERLAFEISLNPRISGLHYSHYNLQDAEQYNMIMRDLRVYKTSSSFIDNMYLYLNSTGEALTYNSYLPKDLFMDKLKQFKGTSDEQWLKLLQEKHVNEFVPIVTERDGKSTVDTIAYIKSLPIDHQGVPHANLVILIETSKLLQSLQNIAWFNGGSVMIVDENGQALASTSTELPSIAQSDLTESKITSKTTSWSYVSVIPTKEIKKKSIHVRHLTLLGWALSILLGGLLTYFFLKRNYDPINNLLTGVVKSAGIPLGDKQNEYEAIEEAFTNTFGEKEEIKKTLNKQKNRLKETDLARLLKGQLTNLQAVDDMLASHQIRFGTDRFVVLMLEIEKEGKFFENEFVGLNENGKLKLAQLIVSNVTEELVSRSHYGVLTEIDDQVVSILNISDVSDEQIRSDILEIVEEARQFIYDKYDFALKVAVSDMKFGIVNVPAAYKEAQEIMEYNNILGLEGITFFEEIGSGDLSGLGADYVYPQRIEQQLVNCVKIGDAEKARELLQDIFEQNKKTIPLSVPAAKLIMVQLSNTMVKTLFEISVYFDDVFLHELNPVHRLLSCQNIPDIQVQMEDIINEVCSYIERKRKTETTQIQDDVREFVAEHYFDMNLNISMIGDQFGMTPSYLSKLFREQAGVGLLDYINQYRLEKAKELLKDKQLNVTEIATAVGFVNSNTFIRQFKKYEGITPGNYKKIVEMEPVSPF